MTRYTFTGAGQLEKISHIGKGVEEEYSYRYDKAGNKVGAEKKRQGIEADSGTFAYLYDALNRLTEVSRDGQLLRRYTYDAFGNRTLKEDYGSGTPEQTMYRYNAKNQLVSLTDREGEQAYSYDRRGNLMAVRRGGELLKAFTFDAADRMGSAFQVKGGIGKRAEYAYNAFGNRIGQAIYSGGAKDGIPDMGSRKPKDPEKQIRYTIDLTKQYHNVLMSEDSVGGKTQTFYWDGNVAAMEEAGQDSYYLQDDLGSPMQLLDGYGEIRESYGFDEFGQSLFPDGEQKTQPFGYTGYEMEEAGGLYFAQARRYDAGAGRFVSEDVVKGLIALPHTLNSYSYCWNQPMEHVDLDGRFAWGLLALAALGIGLAAFALTGCGKENQNQYPMPVPGNHVYKYTADIYNSDEYRERTNCYAYAFDIIENPITGKSFYTKQNAYNSYGELAFAAQPGLFSGQYAPYDTSIVSGNDEGNKKIVDLVKADAKEMGLNFQEYEEGMSGGYAVLLVISPGADYHWYRQDADGTWSHKPGSTKVISGVRDPIADAQERKYTSIVGYYYITEACDNE